MITGLIYFLFFATYCLKFIFYTTRLYAKTYLMKLANNLKANFSCKNFNIKNWFFQFLLKFDFRLFAKRSIYAKINFSNSNPWIWQKLFKFTYFSSFDSSFGRKISKFKPRSLWLKMSSFKLIILYLKYFYSACSANIG